MRFKEIKDKVEYYKNSDDFYKGYGMIKMGLDDKKYCLHCEQKIRVGDFKVEFVYDEYTRKDDELVVCPNAPECDGTTLDWMSEDLYDQIHKNDKI